MVKGSYLYKGILVSLLFLIACSPSADQGRGTPDSNALVEKLAEAQKLSESSPLKSSELALEALAKAESMEYRDLVAEAQMILCTYTTPPLAIDTTLSFCREAMAYFEQVDAQREQGILLNSIGILHDIKGEKDAAVQSFKNAEDIFLALEDLEWLGQVYNNWGVVHVTENSLEAATRLYIRALEVNETLENRRGLMATHCNLGRLYYKQRLFKQAREHAEKGVKLAKETQSATWLPLSLNLIADIYNKRGQISDALLSYEEALTIATKNGDDYNLIFTLNRLARFYLNNNQPEKALSYIQRSLNRAMAAGKRKDLEEIYLIIGECRAETGQFEVAKTYIDTAYTLAQGDRDYKYLLQAYQQYGDLYYDLGNYKLSISFQKRFQALQDSINHLENEELLSRLEREFQRKEQEQQIFELKEKSSQQYLFLVLLSGLAGMIVIISSGLFFYYRRVRKFNEELETKVQERTEALKQSNTQLERFAYIASHDLKTPLRTISSFLSLIKRRIKKYNNPELEDLLSFASNGAKQMNNLIEDVLEFSKVSTAEMKKEAVDLNQTIRSVLYNIDDFLRANNGYVETHKLPAVMGNGGYLHQLFQNLIVNGVKYNETKKPRVIISCQMQGKNYRFCVEDNGIGIDLAYQDTVFEMFKRLHTSAEYEGTGIGLALCKKIVEQHGGEIWLEDSSPQGTIFCFTLPQAKVPLPAPSA